MDLEMDSIVGVSADEIKSAETDKRERLLPYEKSNLYRKARELLRDSVQIQSKLNKSYKYTLGQCFVAEIIELTQNIFLAFQEKDIEKKELAIRGILKNVQKALIQMRVLHDLSQVARDLYVHVVSALVSCNEQSEKWLATILKQKEQGQ